MEEFAMDGPARIRWGRIPAVIALLVFLGGCAAMEGAYHRHIMRGQVLEVTGNEVCLCIGSNDGARVGQELTVVRFERGRASGGMKGSGADYKFKRIDVGLVKIAAIVDAHYATATVMSGTVRENDTVELESAQD
jgi:hypothetical protein